MDGLRRQPHRPRYWLLKSWQLKIFVTSNNQQTAAIQIFISSVWHEGIFSPVNSEDQGVSVWLDLTKIWWYLDSGPCFFLESTTNFADGIRRLYDKQTCQGSCLLLANENNAILRPFCIGLTIQTQKNICLLCTVCAKHTLTASLLLCVHQTELLLLPYLSTAVAWVGCYSNR